MNLSRIYNFCSAFFIILKVCTVICQSQRTTTEVKNIDQGNRSQLFFHKNNGKIVSRPRRSNPDVLYFSNRDISITVYEDKDYGGLKRSITFPENDCYSWSEDNWWNDNVSMVVTHGWCFRHWSYQDCTGHSYCFCYGSGNLKEQMMTERRSWDEEISSFSGCSYKGGYTAIATFYPDRDFKGTSSKFILKKNECLSFFPGDWRNDVFSSANVSTGCVEYFRDSYCKGSSFKLRGQESYVGDFYENRISSIKPC